MTGQAQIEKTTGDAAPSPLRAAERQPRLTIRPIVRTFGWTSLRDAWNQRELAYFLTLRDLKLRYKQTSLGAVWTVLQPLIATGIFSIVFGKFAKIGSEGLPYPLFCFAALLPWNYFANSLGRGSTSLVANGFLLNKIYVPRLLVPAAAMIPGLVDFTVGSVALLGLCVYYRTYPQLMALWLVPLLMALVAAIALGISLCLGALNVRYRDVTNVLPFATQLLLFLTPVIYPSTLIQGKYALIGELNPLVPLIEGIRHALFGGPIPWLGLAASASVAGLSLTAGFWVFSRMEQQFADIL